MGSWSYQKGRVIFIHGCLVFSWRIICVIVYKDLFRQPFGLLQTVSHVVKNRHAETRRKALGRDKGGLPFTKSFRENPLKK